VASVWDVIQQIASVTRHVSELQAQLSALEQRFSRFQERVNERLREHDVEIATLKVEREMMREMIRAEIATAIADLRVQYAEDTARRRRPKLGGGEP
jgi:predicted  nucleic acid-binding Zn-ribbon protein